MGDGTATKGTTLPLWAAKALRAHQQALARAGDSATLARDQRRGLLLDKLQQCGGITLGDLIERGTWQPDSHGTEYLLLDGYMFGLFTDWDSTGVGLLGRCQCGAECIALFSTPQALGNAIKTWRMGLGAWCAEHQPANAHGLEVHTVK